MRWNVMYYYMVTPMNRGLRTFTNERINISTPTKQGGKHT